MVAQRMFTSVDNFPFMAVPFFILAGNLMAKGGISKRLIGFTQILFSRMPASLANITTVSSAFFGAISGSNPATVASIGSLMVPAMKEAGYPTEKAAAVAASSGTLGVVIPPSIPMVTYAITASVSIGTMFIAGLVPGILLTIALIIVNVITCRKHEAQDTKTYSSKEIFLAFKDAIWALIMPLIILGGIYGGIFTPTEASSVACVYAYLISTFVYKELKTSDLRGIFAGSAVSTAIVLFVVSLSAPFSWYMTSLGLPGAIAEGVLGIFHNHILILLTLNVILLFLGCFLETQSIILLMTPMLLPIAASLGMHPIALGLLIIVNTSVGMITPPMAVNLFVASSVAKISLEKISGKILPFLFAEIVVLLMMTYFPDIVMWLPNIVAQ
jgi:C4-dicarboxylate transporter DctM subunit